LKPLRLGSSLEGWAIVPEWEHFGDAGGPGDLFLTWEHRFGCSGTEADRRELLSIVRACEGGYATRDEAEAALAASVDAWEHERDPGEAVKAVWPRPPDNAEKGKPNEVAPSRLPGWARPNIPATH